MDDKERLEEIKGKYSKANIIEHINGVDIIAVDKADNDYLINQSELALVFESRFREVHEKLMQSHEEVERLEDENETLAVAYDNARKEIRILKNKYELLGRRNEKVC